MGETLLSQVKRLLSRSIHIKGCDDSGVAFLSHKLMLFRPRGLLYPPFRVTAG